MSKENENLNEAENSALNIADVSQQRELLFGFLEYLKNIDALKHTEKWQLKTYVDNYEAKL